MRTPIILIASLAAAVALVLPGCGDSGTEETANSATANGATATPLAKKVTVTMGEWFFRVDHARVKAGKVTVTARNVGDIEHELIAVKTNLPAGQMPMTREGLDVDGAGEPAIGRPHGHGDEHGGDEHMDETDEHMDDGEPEDGHLKAGERRRYTVNLKPGRYVLLCSIPGHYQMGQYVGMVSVRA